MLSSARLHGGAPLRHAGDDRPPKTPGQERSDADDRHETKPLCRAHPGAAFPRSECRLINVMEPADGISAANKPALATETFNRSRFYGQLSRGPLKYTIG
jgi:hypothetical protein